MITAEKIKYHHKTFPILDGVDVSVSYGEFLAIVGPNGAGKSSLLSVLANEVKQGSPSEVLFKNKPLTKWVVRELAFHKAKFSQHNSTDIPLRVRDVVMMGRYPYFEAQAGSTDETAISEAMRATDILHLAERDYNTLSGGEKQRVHLSRVLSQLENDIAHKLIFLDEPLNNLDVKHQYRALHLIQQFTRKANSAIVVLHDLNLAAQFADKILLMKEGKVAAYGRPKEVFTSENLSATYSFPCTVCPNPVNKNPMIIFG